MKKALASLLALVLTLAMFPFNALADAAYSEISYVDANGESQTAERCRQLIASEGNTLTEDWYYVWETVTYSGSLTVSGSVNLILCDSCKLTANGINISSGSTLTIWAQSRGSGMGVLVSSADNGPGIGGTGGNLVINGGDITATGGNHAAGIGGGDGESSGYESITIRGGDITATGGGSAAGIGGGYCNYGMGKITITGGTVNATGGKYAAGIGGGEDRTSPEILITGGTVTAKAPLYGAGIGGGDEGSGGIITISGGTVTAIGSSGAGIGGGKQGRGGTITISGGNITAEGWQGAGIGGGRFHDGGTINISGGTVNATGKFSAAGIGGGWGGAGGTITITGGQVTATAIATYGADDGTGAGIGGGADAYGGYIQILGGTVDAHTAPGSHAIGCGEYKENNNQELIIGDSLCTFAGNNGINWENDGKPFSASLRAEACKYRTDCQIIACSHPDEHIGFITSGNHRDICDYCMTVFDEEAHIFPDGETICTVCGYNTQDYYTISFLSGGALGSTPELHAVPGSSVTLPDNGFDVPDGCVFGGWICLELDPVSYHPVIKTYPAYSRIENVNENRTMYAKWLSMITIGMEDQEVTYSPGGIAIPVEGMFTIPEEAGAAAYSVDNLMGIGTYDAETGILAVSESGTFTVRVNTAETDTHAAASADAVLTVKKALATEEMTATAALLPSREGQTEVVSYTLPERAAFGEASNEHARFFSVDTSDGIVLTAGSYTAEDWPVGEIKTFTVPVTGAANYNDYTLTVTVTPICNLPPFGEADFVLPANTAVIEESTFEGVSGLKIVDAASCTSIGPNVFSRTALEQIRLPGNCAIDPLAFEGCGTVCVFAPAGGQTETSCAGIKNCVFMEIN